MIKHLIPLIFSLGPTLIGFCHQNDSLQSLLPHDLQKLLALIIPLLQTTVTPHTLCYHQSDVHNCNVHLIKASIVQERFIHFFIYFILALNEMLQSKMADMGNELLKHCSKHAVFFQLSESQLVMNLLWLQKHMHIKPASLFHHSFSFFFTFVFFLIVCIVTKFAHYFSFFC